MKISILHPSRSRPEEAYIAYRHWVLKMSGKYEYEYILSIDVTDIMAEAYLKGAFHGPQNQIIINDNNNVVQATNEAAKVSSGDIIVLISDDFNCFDNWDLAIVDALKGKSGVLKTFDGVQRWIVTLPIMTKDYYDSQGYFYDPAVHHMFCDTIMTHKADLQKKLIIRNDIVFTHDHYSKKGGTRKKDSVNIKADGTWAQGEKVYLQRCRERFGLGNVNVYNLSPEANKAGHINWMKKKGVK
jgi:glycosyltransferase involved in cell wall biosynthesis